MEEDNSCLAKWDCKVVHPDPKIGEGITPRFSRNLIKQGSDRKIAMFSYPGYSLHLVKASDVELIE